VIVRKVVATSLLFLLIAGFGISAEANESDEGKEITSVYGVLSLVYGTPSRYTQAITKY
jgi:hypothetical protein